ncbi:MAG: ABC transporter permease [Thermosediminibacteraceae bacterium]|nr:ABC transporter permease [Thermosediminibacteraceae bacterium]
MVRNFGNTLYAFFIKKRAEYRRYWLDFAVGLAIKFIFFLGTLYASPIHTGSEAAIRLFGFSIWYLCAHVVSKLGNTVIEEAYLGTLEQVLSTRARPWQLVFGLIVAEILFSFLWIAIFFVMAVLIVGVNHVWSGLVTHASSLLIFGVISLIGMIGVGLTILGLSLRFKQVGSITEVLLYYLLVFSGFFLPPQFLPDFLHALNALSPLAWAVKGMNEGWSALPPAIMSSAAWIFLGVLILITQWNWVRQSGRLGTYV